MHWSASKISRTQFQVAAIIYETFNRVKFGPRFPSRLCNRRDFGAAGFSPSQCTQARQKRPPIDVEDQLARPEREERETDEQLIVRDRLRQNRGEDGEKDGDYPACCKGEGKQ